MKLNGHSTNISLFHTSCYLCFMCYGQTFSCMVQMQPVMNLKLKHALENHVPTAVMKYGQRYLTF